jgi:hypothetical protein
MEPDREGRQKYFAGASSLTYFFIFLTLQRRKLIRRDYISQITPRADKKLINVVKRDRLAG